MTNLAQYIGTTLREHRLAQGIVKNALAAQIGRTKNHLHNLERGTAAPETFTDLERLLDALDLELVIRPKDHLG